MHPSDDPVQRNRDELDGVRPAARRAPRRRARNFSPLEGIADFVTERVGTIGESLKTLAAIRKDRAQLAFRRRKQDLIVAVVAGIAGATALVYAVILLVGGVAAGMRRWIATAPWAGDVVTALLVLGLVASALALLFRAENRRSFEDARARYARPPETRSDVDAG